MESDTEVRPRKKPRSFTAETKARLLAEYDAAGTSRADAPRRRLQLAYLELAQTGQRTARQTRAARQPGGRRKRAATQREPTARAQTSEVRTYVGCGKKTHAPLQMIAGKSIADEARSKPS